MQSVLRFFINGWTENGIIRFCRTAWKLNFFKKQRLSKEWWTSKGRLKRERRGISRVSFRGISA